MNTPSAADDEAGKLSAFYSTAATVLHVRPGIPPTPEGQLLIGTFRPWFSRDMGIDVGDAADRAPIRWPARTTPARTAFGEPITVCKWQSDDVAWLLGEGRLERLSRVPGSTVGGGLGTWNSPRALIIRKGVKNKKDDTSAEGPIRDAAVWTDIAVNLDPTTADPDSCGQQPARRARSTWARSATRRTRTSTRCGGSTATRRGTRPGCATRQRRHGTGHGDRLRPGASRTRCTSAPRSGVWRGRAHAHGDRPADVGLAAARQRPARGRGRGPLAVRRRRAAPAAGRRSPPAACGSCASTWPTSIDRHLRARPRRRPALPRPSAVDDAARRRDGPLVARQPRRAAARRRRGVAAARRACRGRAADVGRSPTSSCAASRRRCGRAPATCACRATGVWDLYFEEVLRDNGAPVAGRQVEHRRRASGTPRWRRPTTPPNRGRRASPAEADLLRADGRRSTRAASPRSRAGCRPRPAKVDVVVHHRGLDPIAGADVRVTLLRWMRPASRNRGQADDVDHVVRRADIPWAAAVDEVLNSAGGTTSVSLGGTGWSFVGTNAAARRKTLTGQTLRQRPLRAWRRSTST